MPTREMVRRVEPLWGTMIGVRVCNAIDVRAVDAVFAWFRRVDALFSTWRPETEICRIGRGELAVADASLEVQAVIDACDRLRVETAGAFDVRASARAHSEPVAGVAPLDPSGFVKGWALERAMEMLERAGASRCSINAGGDVVVRAGDDDEPWRIGIQHPWARGDVAEVVAVSSGGVATSGRNERGDHVIDPRTLQPARGLMSVTVIGPDLGVADALATAAVAHGSMSESWLCDRPGIAALGITDDRRVLVTREFARHRAAG